MERCIYCGDKLVLPDGYDDFGTRYQCLKRGVGVGKYGERSKWNKKLGLPDDKYVSKCGANRVNNRVKTEQKKKKRSNK